MAGSRTKHLNGLAGVISEHPREGHPTFIRKPSRPDKPRLTVCVVFSDPIAAKGRSALLEPQFLKGERAAMAEKAAGMTALLERLAAQRAADEMAVAEKIAAETAAAEKAVAERAAAKAERAAYEKAAAEKAAVDRAEKAAAAEAAAEKAADEAWQQQIASNFLCTAENMDC